MKEIVEEKLPKIMREAEDFSYRVEEVKEHASHEFEALGVINKGKALVAFGINAKTLAKVPTMIKSSLESFKS